LIFGELNDVYVIRGLLAVFLDTDSECDWFSGSEEDMDELAAMLVAPPELNPLPQPLFSK